MRSFGIKILSIFVVFCLLVPFLGVSAAGEAVSLNLSYHGDAFVGGQITVKIAVSKPSEALAGLDFVLKYDPNFVTPVITANTDENREMDEFFTKKPTGWEQFSYHSAQGSFYQLRLAVGDDSKNYLNTASGLVLEIPFTVNAAGSFKFQVPDGDVVAISAGENLTPLQGKGGELAVVTSSDTEKIAVNIKGRDAAAEGGIYYVDIEATNLGDNSGFVAVEFDLQYDKKVFVPTITENNENAPNMDKVIVSAPKDSWEQMCSLDTTKGKYILRFAALHCESKTESEILKSGQSLKISIPFKVVGAEGALGDFKVSDVSVIAANNNSAMITGSGSKKTVSVEKGSDFDVLEANGFKIQNGYLLFLKEKTEIDSFLSSLKSMYFLDRDGKYASDKYIGTDFVLTDGTKELTMVVLGDCNGNGTVTSVDYVMTKRICFQTYKPSRGEVYSVAIGDGEKPTAKDYVLIKRHCFQTYNLYA